MNLEVNDYVIMFMIIIIIYLICKKYINEKFTDTIPDTDIINRINDTFKADLSPIINLGQVLNNLNTPGETYDMTSISNMIVNNLDAKTLECDNLVINGDIDILDINNLEKPFSIYPRYMIMIWAKQTMPKGWALCDGSTWYVNIMNNDYLTETQYQGLDSSVGYEKVIVPDLQNRFIIGATHDNTNDTYSLGKTGGAEKVILTQFDIPPHYHTLPIAADIYNISANGPSTKKFNITGDNDGYIGDGIYISPSWAMPALKDHFYKGISFQMTSQYGGYSYKMMKYTKETNKFSSPGYAVETDYARQVDTPPSNTSTPHENMPPYYKLFYIMKL